MNRTDDARYRVVYPDGRVVDGLAWDARRALMMAAPQGTRWEAADGTVLAVVRGTWERYWAAVGKADAAFARGAA